MWPALSALGFQIPSWQRAGVDYRFGIGPLVPSLYSGKDEPALSLGLGIQKRQAVVSLFETARSERTEEFLRANSALIETLTGRPPDPEKQAVWRIGGKGWAGSTDDLAGAPGDPGVLVAELAPRLAPLGEAAGTAHREQLESTTVELASSVSEDGEPVVQRTSLWSRLRGHGRS